MDLLKDSDKLKAEEKWEKDITMYLAPTRDGSKMDTPWYAFLRLAYRGYVAEILPFRAVCC